MAWIVHNYNFYALIVKYGPTHKLYAWDWWSKVMQRIKEYSCGLKGSTLHTRVLQGACEIYQNCVIF